MIVAIIFDFDGVVIDSENMKAEAWKNVLKEYGIKNGDDWYKDHMGITRLNLCTKAINEFDLSASADELYKKKVEIYSRMLEEGTRPINSTINFLKSILKDNFKIGLASAESLAIINRQLRIVGIYDIFDAITSGEDEVENNKPSPEIYLLTAKKLEVKPSECVAIEDSEAGVEAAKNAGMRCIGYRNEDSGNQDLSKADLIIDDLSKLSVDRIRKLNS